MKKMLIIIFILTLILIGMLVYRSRSVSNSEQVTINEIENIETYISEIYMWREITNEALPTFDNINNANELWIWEVVKKNLEEFELDYQQIQDKAKEIFGEDFKKESPKEGSQSFEYNEETQKYYPTEINLDNKEDMFLLNTIEKTDEGYKVEIIEYIEDYSKIVEGQNTIIIENLNQEQIGQVSEQDSEQNIQDIVKRNIDKFSKKQIYLKQQNDKLYVEKVEN